MPSSLPSGAGSSQQSTTWETLSEMSFNHTVYVPCLKLSITSGSFVVYTANNETDSDNCVPRVGRVLEVVSSIEMVSQSERFPAIQESFEVDSTTSTNEMPIQFVKVNVFKNRSLLSDTEFPVDDGQSFPTRTSGGNWQVVVQLEEYDWIKPDAITNLAFVFPDEAVTSHCYEDRKSVV